jgi:hypothetical protein
MKRIKILDIFVIILLISISLFYFKLSKPSGKKELFLLLNNKTINLKFGNYKLNLYEKYKKHITIEVNNNRARIIKSDCINKICIKKGWISNCGESAICLPNKTAIQIKCEGQFIDAISQ